MISRPRAAAGTASHRRGGGLNGAPNLVNRDNGMGGGWLPAMTRDWQPGVFGGMIAP
jgi:hypothetical protein